MNTDEIQQQIRECSCSSSGASMSEQTELLGYLGAHRLCIKHTGYYIPHF